jgi:DNA-binding PadR family transcriptional regulator
MDVLVLAELRKGAMSGYDAISYIHNKFGVLVSSGTVYSHLYALEREGLVEGTWDTKKRVYAITEQGKQALKVITKTNMELLNTLKTALNP